MSHRPALGKNDFSRPLEPEGDLVGPCMAYLDPPMVAKHGYESPVSEHGNVGQDTNCTSDFAALAERKNAASADGPDDSQQPHDRKSRTRQLREIARVRKTAKMGPMREMTLRLLSSIVGPDFQSRAA
jgi:hypothetical protein